MHSSLFEIVLYSDMSVYRKEYEKYEVLDELDMTMDDAMYVTREMMDYLRGDKETLSVEERINRAFRYNRNEEKRPECEKIYMSYVLGGIEVLYEKLIEPSNTLDDYVMNLYRFTSDFKKRYYEESVNEEIYELCKLAAN